jgi:hypothetical protein
VTGKVFPKTGNFFPAGRTHRQRAVSGAGDH